MADRCFSCGKVQGKGYGRTWIIQQPHNLMAAVERGWLKPNFFRRRRLERLVQRIKTDRSFMRSFPGVLHCPDCLDVIHHGPVELREAVQKAREENTRKWAQEISKQIQADNARQTLIEKLSDQNLDDS